MLNNTIDYTQIKLVENIPLSSDDLMYIEQESKAFKLSPIVPALCMLLLVSLLFWFVQDDYHKLKKEDYLFYAVITFCISIITYFIFHLNKRSHLKNFKKDFQVGKCELTSIVINRHEVESHEKLVFAGPPNCDSIMLKVERADFNQYKIGTKVIVTYLKYSKETLLIKKCK